MSNSPASPTSPSASLVCQMNSSGSVPDQPDTNKILRFFRVPGSRFKSVQELLVHHGYQIEGGKFSEGEYSQLFRAKYIKTGILVACKQIDLSKTRPVLTSREMSRSDSTTALAYIKNELHMLKKLSEQSPSPPPYIIRLYTHFVVNENNSTNTLYVFLKLAPEGSLAHYVYRCGPLDEPQAAIIFSQLTVALEYLHSVRITHRDVKLEAILLLTLPDKKGDAFKTSCSSNSFTVMLTNFGASRTVTMASQTQQGLCHTVCGAGGQYTPPELLDEKVMATSGYNPFMVDIWMAGITLYGMICYPAFPFPQGDTQTQLRAQCSRAWRWPQTVKPSPPLHALLWAMLQPDPVARICVQALPAQQWISTEYKTAVRRAQQRQPQPKQQLQQKLQPTKPKSQEVVSSRKSSEKSISGKIKECISTIGYKSRDKRMSEKSNSGRVKSSREKSTNIGITRNKSSKNNSTSKSKKRSALLQVVKTLASSKHFSAPKSTSKSSSKTTKIMSLAKSKSNKK